MKFRDLTAVNMSMLSSNAVGTVAEEHTASIFNREQLGLADATERYPPPFVPEDQGICSNL